MNTGLRYSKDQRLVLVNPYAFEAEQPLVTIITIDDYKFLDRDGVVTVFEGVNELTGRRFISTPINPLISTATNFMALVDTVEEAKRNGWYYDAEELLQRLRLQMEEIEEERQALPKEDVEGNQAITNRIVDIHDYMTMVLILLQDQMQDTFKIEVTQPQPGKAIYKIKLNN